MEKFKFVLSDLWEWLKPVIIFLLTEAGKALILSASTAVALVESNMADKSSSEKRDAAFRMIESDMKSKGYELGIKFINMALEAAVVKLSAERTKTQ